MDVPHCVDPLIGLGGHFERAHTSMGLVPWWAGRFLCLMGTLVPERADVLGPGEGVTLQLSWIVLVSIYTPMSSV